MLLDFLTYILIITAVIAVLSTIFGGLKEHAWVGYTNEDDPILHLFASVDKDYDSGAGEVRWINDSGEAPIGYVKYEDRKVWVMVRNRKKNSIGQEQYRRVGYVDDKGYIYRKTEKDLEPVRVGFLAKPSEPSTPCVVGERSLRYLWFRRYISVYIGDPELTPKEEDDDEPKKGMRKNQGKRKNRSKDNKTDGGQTKIEGNEADNDVEIIEEKESVAYPKDIVLAFAEEKEPSKFINNDLLAQVEEAFNKATEEIEQISYKDMEPIAHEAPVEESDELKLEEDKDIEDAMISAFDFSNEEVISEEQIKDERMSREEFDKEVNSFKIKPILVGQGLRTGWLDANNGRGTIGLEARAGAFMLFLHLLEDDNEEYREHVVELPYTWKDTALLSSIILTILFLCVYFVNTGIMEMPLLGNDLKAIFIFFGLYVAIWAIVRQIKIKCIENGRPIQSRLDLLNKSLGQGSHDMAIMILAAFSLLLAFSVIDPDFIPLIVVILFGVGMNSSIRENKKQWKVKNPLEKETNPEPEKIGQRIARPEGDNPVEFEWEGKRITFSYNSEDIEVQRLANPFYLERPKVRHKASLFRKYIQKMIETLNTSPEMTVRTRYVLQEINTYVKKKGLNNIDKINLILSFVQNSIKYVKDIESKEDLAKPLFYVRYPDETLYNKQGDCKDKAFLAAYMLFLDGYEVNYISSTKLQHTAFAVRMTERFCQQLFKNDPKVVSVIDDIKYYVFCEATSPGFKLGQISDNDSIEYYDIVIEINNEKANEK